MLSSCAAIILDKQIMERHNFKRSLACISLGCILCFLYFTHCGVYVATNIYNQIGCENRNNASYRNAMQENRPFYSPPLSADGAKNGHDVDRVMFPRIPKTGSTTSLWLLRQVASKNDWHLTPDTSRHKNALDDLMRNCKHCKTNDSYTDKVQWSIIELILSRKGGVGASGHFMYIDTRHFVPQMSPPVYISVIRDPLQRVVSKFYYLKKTILKHPETLHKDIHKLFENSPDTFEECVRKMHPSCVKDGSAVQQICGYDPVCTTSSAVQRAKRNIMMDFPVFGLLEHYDKFLTILEFILPRQFRGITGIYINLDKSGKSHRNTNKHNNDSSEQTTAKIMELFAGDYDLYNFIQQRFFYQYEILQKT